MRVRLLMLLVVVLAVGAACSGDSDPFGLADQTTAGEGNGPSTTTPRDPDTTSATSATTALPPSTLIEQIAAEGVLRVGIYDRPFLPLADPATESGFEPDLARELASRLFDGVTVEFVPLTAPERFDALSNGTVDMLIRGTSHTTSREQEVAFTTPYLLDGLTVVVPGASGWATPEDLRGAELAVRAGTTLELMARDHFAAIGVPVDWVPTENLRDLLAAGTVDGYVDSWVLAANAVTADPALTIIWLEVIDPIAVALPLGDQIYRDWVDQVLTEIITDGTWDTLVTKWTPTPIPWTIKEMLAQPPSDR
jgi:ABC-type amino acid transport substrate-binding protein